MREQEDGLCYIINFFGRYKKLILVASVGVGVLAGIVVMLLPNVYTATVFFVQVQQVQQVQQAQQVLESRVLADELIKQFSLVGAYGSESQQEARKSLKEATRIKLNKNGVFVIQVEDVDPARAAAIANAYPLELDKRFHALGLSDSARSALLLEMRLSNFEEALKPARAAMETLSPLVGTEHLKADEDAIKGMATLRAEIDFADETESRVLSSHQDMARLYEGFADLVKADANELGKAKTKAALDYLDKYRQVQYIEAAIELLQKRLRVVSAEFAVYKTRILDPAVVPEKKSKSKRLLIVVLAMLAAGIVVVLSMLLKEWLAISLERIREPRNA